MTDPETRVETAIPDLRAAALRRQSVVMSLVGGVIGLVVSSGAWVLIVALTGFNTILYAFVAGIVVGLCVWALGRGCTPAFGLIGAAFALGATLISYVIVVQIYQANAAQTPLFTHMSSQSPVDWFTVYFQQYLSPLHFLAYAIAGLEGYSLSFRKV